MTEAYSMINKLVTNHGASNIDTIKLKELIKGFDKPQGPGFIFTLNQNFFWITI
ncbi:MAG: hypothetical protein K0R24_981 [Gammaproteobacteria bacterium]|jgi:hypothetical protein|nr:hypothetical protein [Gammaproteobacteria bacterium]MCE3238000.1 hypothetical protein [Gammaproteobacteria bacterium]